MQVLAKSQGLGERLTFLLERKRLNGDMCPCSPGRQLLSWLHHPSLIFNVEDLLLAWSLGCQHDVLMKRLGTASLEGCSLAGHIGCC